MPVPLMVPDASVLLKWVLPCDDERYADNALLLRAAIQDEAVHVLLPGLWLFEAGHTIARRFPTHASAWLSALMKFGLEEGVFVTADTRYVDRATAPGSVISLSEWQPSLIPPPRRRKTGLTS